MSSRATGDLGERIAEAFLRLKGYDILRRNFRYAGREIDLLVRKDGCLVAVEVKLRRGNRKGRAIEAIDGRKIARLNMALRGALEQARRPYRPRVDVVVIDLDEKLERLELEHIEAIY